MEKKHAFTLAEVLITLTIIGVIAAITIPNLMQKHKKTETAAKLKQVYSKMQSVTQTAIAETGLEPEDWLTKEEQGLSLNDRREIIYTKYIKPYLKTRNFNKTTGVFYDESGTKYTLLSAPNNDFFKQAATNDYKYLMARLSADINGDKGPNEDGKDIFYFTYKVNNQGPFNHHDQKISFAPLTCGLTMTWNGKSYNSFEQYKEASYHNSGTYPHCNPQKTTNRPDCCADVIMRENWQIKDDYPFKL